MSNIQEFLVVKFQHLLAVCVKAGEADPHSFHPTLETAQESFRSVAASFNQSRMNDTIAVWNGCAEGQPKVRCLCLLCAYTETSHRASQPTRKFSWNLQPVTRTCRKTRRPRNGESPHGHINTAVAAKGHSSHTNLWSNPDFTPFPSHNRHDTVTFVLPWQQGEPEGGIEILMWFELPQNCTL